MTHSVEYDAVENMVMAGITGKVNLAELREFAVNIIRTAKRENCFRILTDLSKAELNVSVMQTFNLPQDIVEFAAAEGLEIHAFKRAFVASENQDVLDFYETVARNRSHHIRLFHDIEEAKAWLKK
ncbi:MAG: hypothetical protein IPO36_08215 [Anaerolineales bacterium]|nr:hypothetical protein [Anaerolineales bacterium]